MAASEDPGRNPRLGMLATLRNRRGIVTDVEPHPGPKGDVHHLVTLEYLDPDGPPEDRVIWERERERRLLEPSEVPDASNSQHMTPADFDALTRAVRWTALNPFVDPDGSAGPLDRLPITSPTHGAIQVDDFQLVPLVVALRMPRVSLLLADDVGLGKTIEAGLILAELIQRRRLRRVLITVPASLCNQWQEEMESKFSLSFDIVDRESTHRLRRQLGMDANPWRTYSRIITSYYYLKQSDVLEDFKAASRAQPGSPHLPWDLLIVDEVHNLTPSPFGDDSDLSKMLGDVSPMFEHKLFLTATPHNGHTRCYSGLLERLDPVRFSQTNELSPAEKARAEEVVIRRLKRDINARTDPPRFADRFPHAVPVALSPEEQALASSFRDFRTSFRKLLSGTKRGEQLAGSFAMEVLGKRLLSCPVAFADSWRRCQMGIKEDEHAEATEVRAAQRAVEEDTDDDQELESRTSHATRVVGAWLKPFADDLADEMAAVDAALEALGLPDETVDPKHAIPAHDARFAALSDLIDERLRTSAGGFRGDERLIVFTEFKTTLDYLVSRLRERHPEEGVIRELYGERGRGRTTRQSVIRAFNDPCDPVRVLVSTDTGSEGLNLHETARYLLHFDVPWNPARMEQRNGRLDRHGQARDVTAFHFTSEDDADLDFIAYVVGKIDTIREDLGSTGEVFDAAFQRRFVEGQADSTVRSELDAQVEATKGRAAVPQRPSTETGEEDLKRLEALKAELDLDPTTLHSTLDVAMGIRAGRPRISEPDAKGHSRVLPPFPPDWVDTIDDSLRVRQEGGAQGTMPFLSFDPSHFIDASSGRPVFRPHVDTALLHLAHPMFRRALAAFGRVRFPGSGGDGAATRWTVRRAPIPEAGDANALLMLTVEELAVNELRESIHHWVRTLRIPVRDGDLSPPLPHAPASTCRAGTEPPKPDDVERAREIWEEVYIDVRDLISDLRTDLTERLQAAMEEDYEKARKDEQDRFQSRQGELSALIQQTTMQRLEREIDELKEQRQQGVLHIFAHRLDELDASIREKEDELQRRREHYTRLREQLEKERQRILDHVLPRRYALRGEAQVFPVTVEIRLPE